MSVDIEFKDIIISEEQVETFAFNTYQSINEYINNNKEEFDKWYLDDIVIEAIKGESLY